MTQSITKFLKTQIPFLIVPVLFFLCFVASTHSAFALTISGTVYTDRGVTQASGSQNITIAIATSTVSLFATTTNNGAYSFDVPLGHTITTGTPIRVFVDGDPTFKATVATKAKNTTANITGLSLYKDRVIIRTDTDGATSTSLATLNAYDGDNDSDISFSTDGSTYFIVPTDTELLIWKNTVFEPEGYVALFGNAQASEIDGSLYIEGTYKPRNETLLAGHFTASSTGRFIPPDAYSLTFTATTTGKYVRNYSTQNGVWSFGNVVINGTGGSLEFNMPYATTSNLTVTAGSTLIAPTSSLAIIGSLINNGVITNPGVLSFAGTGKTISGIATTSLGSVSVQNKNIDWTQGGATANVKWNDVAYGNGVFVAVAGDGTFRIMQSVDGVNWTLASVPVVKDWRGVTFGNGLFVAVSISGDVVTSSDGISWTWRRGADEDGWQAVTFGNGLFVAVANRASNRVKVSSDGITWTAYPSAGENYDWDRVGFGNGLFYSYAGNSGLMISSDGRNWTMKGHYPGMNPYGGVAYGNGIAVISGQSWYGGPASFLYSTNNGSTWTLVTTPLPTAVAWYDVAFGDGLFVAVAPGGYIATSTNGTSWATSSVPGADFTSVTYGNGKFVAISKYKNNASHSSLQQSPSLSLSSSQKVGDVSIGNGAVLSINSGVSLDVSGNYQNNGTQNVASSSMLFSSTSAQTIGGTLTGGSMLGSTTFAGTGAKTFLQNASTTDFTIASTSGAVSAPPLLSMSGNYHNDGIFNAGTGTTTFAGTDQTLGGILNATSSFYNVEFRGSGRKTLSFPTDLEIKKDLLVSGGVILATTTALQIGGNYTNGGEILSEKIPSGEWEDAVEPSGQNNWESITYGNGLFVAVSENGTYRVATSPNGINWTMNTSSPIKRWQSVTYGNGLFVAVNRDAGPNVMTSIDGLTWTMQSTPLGVWSSVTYGNGLFVAIGINNTLEQIMTSPDGITWTARSAAENNLWNSVTYGNGLFVAVASDGTNRVMTSPDGINWTARSAAEAQLWESVTYGNGLFIAVGNGSVMTSRDGVNWVLKRISNYGMSAIGFGNNRFVIVGSPFNSSSIISLNVLTVETRFNGDTSQVIQGNLIEESSFQKLVFENDGSKKFLNNASTTHFTINGDSGDVIAPPVLTVSGNYVNDGHFIHNNGTLIFDGEGDQSLEGMLTDSSSLSSVIFSGEGVKNFSVASTTHVTVKEGSEVRFHTLDTKGNYSNEGVSEMFSWQNGSEIFNGYTLSDMSYGNGLFVAVGDGNVKTSSDGVNWTGYITSPSESWFGIAYGNGLFVALVYNYNNYTIAIMTSPDGINWTPQNDVIDNYWYSITYGNGLFVVVGEQGSGNSSIMTSPDGITWTERQAPEENAWYDVTYGNGRFVAVGELYANNTSMSSVDGVTWVLGDLDQDLYTITYGNGLFVAVSSYGENRVFTSPDGISWSTYVGNSDYKWRWVEYGNGLFVAVADSDNNYNYLGATMVSLDGINWTLVSESDETPYVFKFVNNKFILFLDDMCKIGFLTEILLSGNDFQSISGLTTQTNMVGKLSTTGLGKKDFVDQYSFMSMELGTSTDQEFHQPFDTKSLVASNPGARLTLPASATSTVGVLTVMGSSSNPVLLRSNASGTQAGLFVDGSATVTYADIQDISASSTQGLIQAKDGTSIDRGNNLGWDFGGTDMPLLLVSEDQVFAIGQDPTPIKAFTIVDNTIPVITALNDLRIDIATGSVPMRWDTSDTQATFGGSASNKVSSTVSYEGDGSTLVIDVTDDFTSEDTLVVGGLSYALFSGTTTATTALQVRIGGSGDLTIAVEGDKTVTITGSLIIDAHPNGQVGDMFTFPSATDVVLYRYHLATLGETMEFATTTFTLTGIRGITPADISSVRLYEDTDLSGTVTGGDSLLSSDSEIFFEGSSGIISFSLSGNVPASASYLLVANIAGIGSGDSLTIDLYSDDVETFGLSTFAVVPARGIGGSVTHRKGNISGGGSIGGDAPQGGGVHTGGSQGGGTGIDSNVNGSILGDEVGYAKPSVSGNPRNEWTNATAGVDSDGVYATVAVNQLIQSYGNFGFSIPFGNQITGIEVKIEASSIDGGTLAVALSSDGGATMSTQLQTQPLTATDTIYTLGGPSLLWGRAWTPQHVSNANFMLDVTSNLQNGNVIKIDAIRIKVYHQAQGGGGGGGGAI